MMRSRRAKTKAFMTAARSAKTAVLAGLAAMPLLLASCATVTPSVSEGGETVYTTSLIGFDWTFVMILISFAVLYLFMKKFFFEKIHDFMQAREQKVIDQFDNAAAAQKQAEESLAEYSEKLAKIENERRSILKEAKASSDRRAQEILTEANEKAAEIIRQAQKESEREQEVALEAMRDQVALLAVTAAEQILKKKLDAGEQSLLVDELIEESKSGKWIH